MSVTFEHSDGVSLIRLEGAVDVGCAGDLKELLVERFKAGSSLRLSLDEATVVDVTAIQLLWAASHEARKLGVGFALEGQVPETVRTALAIAGIAEFPVPA